MVMVAEWPGSATFYYGLITVGYCWEAPSEWKPTSMEPRLYYGFYYGLLRYVTVYYGKHVLR